MARRICAWMRQRLAHPVAMVVQQRSTPGGVVRLRAPVLGLLSQASLRLPA